MTARLAVALAEIAAVLFLAGVWLASLYAPKWIGQLIGLSLLAVVVLAVVAIVKHTQEGSS